MDSLPDQLLEQMFDLLNSNSDRNAMSMVSKRWYHVERFTRNTVFIGNCYSVNPHMLISRFPRFRSLSLKGKPRFADFNWGGDVYPWIQALSNVNLEELRLKRMIISDDSLRLISQSFPNFKSLVLINCHGFSTDGLTFIASNCRFLRELTLQGSEIDDLRGQWLSCFPESFTSLISLNFACLKGEVNLLALEKLVARCRNLRNLRVNPSVSLEALQKILVHAPQLMDLGAGSLTHIPDPQLYTKLTNTFSKCTSITSFSGFIGVAPHCLPAFYPLCSNLTSLNLINAPRIYIGVLIKLIRHCTKLERLWILDTIEDRGLRVVGATCKELKELRVFRSNIVGFGNVGVTEQGLVAISDGCPNLNSVVYTCLQMTNAALITVAKNCPNLVRFKLCTVNPIIPDVMTMEPLDEGFGAIVQSCKGLKRLSLSGLLSNQVFLYIGMYGEELEMLSIAFIRESGNGILYVMNGCKKLKKLEIRESVFDDVAFEADLGKYETMRSLWMSSCQVTLGACKRVAEKMPMLNVEVLFEQGDKFESDCDDGLKVNKMYLYRTLVGARVDAPRFVLTL